LANFNDLHRGVSITPLKLVHAALTFAWMCDPIVAGNIGLRSAPSIEKTESWIGRAHDDPATAAFAILLDGRHVGNVVLDRIDSHLSTARLSIYVGEAAARGSGVGRAGLFLALHHGFGALALNKIWLTVHVRNAAAISSYLSAGFAIEGVLRDEFRLDGELLSVFYMGLLAGEFKRLRSS
jgi:RimJ/RimL family protein N-acetyltransferase